MSREWKPGDVALGRYPIWGSGGSDTTYEEMRLVRFAEGWARADDPDDFVRDDNRTQYIEARPLVVIDPEDREAVGLLVDAYVKSIPATNTNGGPILTMQAALREFADPKPPKPEEPTGLGAVVEDADGRRWVRFERPGSPARWYDAGEHAGFPQKWDALDAVRVLSEGVTS